MVTSLLYMDAQVDDRCEDLTPPTLALVGGNPLILEQGDNYTEYGVQVRDQNKEERKSRRISISYSPQWDMV